MQEFRQSSDFKSIVLEEKTLIDVRAPVEFEKGAFPHAVNLPLMSNEERHLIGKTYREKGHDAAVALGYSLVKDEIKQQRVDAWLEVIKKDPHAMLYCFRGGERSKISQEWIAEANREIVRLEGGYKAFRHYLISETERSVERFTPYVIGGRTGSGKTILLNRLENAIDLEGLADHRGSSFGRKVNEQPTQINFENALAYALIQTLEKGHTSLIFEDEGTFIGRLYVPSVLAEYLKKAPLIILETSQEKRIEITFDEYIVKAQESYASTYGEDALQIWIESIRSAMFRIRKRLGAKRYEVVNRLFDEAVEMQKQSNVLEKYKIWIAYLLKEYYDPMYDYQIEKNAERIVFRGTEQEIEAFLKEK